MSSSESRTELPPLDPRGVVSVRKPLSGWLWFDWREVWHFREVLTVLARREITLRYRQTAFGVAWAILQPLLTTAVLALFLGVYAGLSARTPGIPYPLYIFAGLIPWTFFAGTVHAGHLSLITNANLVTKVYIPRIVLPLSIVGAGLFDLVVCIAVLFAGIAAYGIPLSSSLLLLPPVVLATVLCASGIATAMAALCVKYRDFQFVVPFMVQIWMFVTPVFYPSSILPDHWQWAMAMNPMSGVVDGFRVAFLGATPHWPHLVVSWMVAAAVFVIGTSYTRSVDRSFADVI